VHTRMYAHPHAYATTPPHPSPNTIARTHKSTRARTYTHTLKQTLWLQIVTCFYWDMCVCTWVTAWMFLARYAKKKMRKSIQ